MKSFFLLAAILFSTTIFSQSEYRYSFHIESIENIGDAKEFVEATRGLFDVIPTFNDESNFFHFVNSLEFKEEELREKLVPLGYNMTNFRKD